MKILIATVWQVKSSTFPCFVPTILLEYSQYDADAVSQRSALGHWIASSPSLNGLYLVHLKSTNSTNLHHYYIHLLDLLIRIQKIKKPMYIILIL